jgi:hypothetical protein
MPYHHVTQPHPDSAKIRRTTRKTHEHGHACGRPHEPRDAIRDPNETHESRGEPNEGEGNKTAARRYNQATENYGKSGRVESAAAAAKEALDGPEGAELEEAEEFAKKKASAIERRG